MVKLLYFTLYHTMSKNKESTVTYRNKSFAWFKVTIIYFAYFTGYIEDFLRLLFQEPGFLLNHY